MFSLANLFNSSEVGILGISDIENVGEGNLGII
jgi:hypothetical protein